MTRRAAVEFATPSKQNYKKTWQQLQPFILFLIDNQSKTQAKNHHHQQQLFVSIQIRNHYLLLYIQQFWHKAEAEVG